MRNDQKHATYIDMLTCWKSKSFTYTRNHFSLEFLLRPTERRVCHSSGDFSYSAWVFIKSFERIQ